MLCRLHAYTVYILVFWYNCHHVTLLVPFLSSFALSRSLLPLPSFGTKETASIHGSAVDSGDGGSGSSVASPSATAGGLVLGADHESKRLVRMMNHANGGADGSGSGTFSETPAKSDLSAADRGGGGAGGDGGEGGGHRTTTTTTTTVGPTTSSTATTTPTTGEIIRHNAARSTSSI